MGKLSHDDVVVLLMAMAVMLLFSRVASEFGRKLKLPIVVGEILVGILLGPTILGQIAPEISTYIFPITIGSFSFLPDRKSVV